MRLLVLIASLITGVANACDQAATDASRIAVAGGSITEILYFLGEEHRIVAADTTSNYPPEALDFPSVGYVRNLSTEGLLSLDPSLILGEDDMGPPAVLDQIAATGVQIIKLPEAHSSDGVLRKINCIATVLGIEESAQQIIDEKLGATLASLQEIENSNANRPRVAVVLGLRDSVPLGAGSETSGQGLIDMAGAENVFGSFEGWKPISMEAMVKADPEFIIVPERGVNSAGGADKLLAHPALRITTAAKEKNLITMDGMSMLGFGPRTLETALELAEKLHRDDTRAGFNSER